MFIEVKRGKIVAKHEEAPVFDETNTTSKVYSGADDIVVLKAPEMTKLAKTAGIEALASTDKAENAAAIWAAMEAFEIPVKAEKAPKEPKEKKERAAGTKYMPAEGTINCLKPDHGKKGYRKVIYDLICGAATIAELKLLTYEQNGKVCKIPGCDVFDAITLGIIEVVPTEA